MFNIPTQAKTGLEWATRQREVRSQAITISTKCRTREEDTMSLRNFGKITLTLLVANLGLWLYFWIAFAQASQPYNPRPLGHVPVDVYCFWGHSIGLTKSALMYPFMKAVHWVEFPSALVVTLVQNMFFSRVSADQFLGGVSVGGYKLLAIMFLSFGQWYLIGRIVQRLWKRPAGEMASVQPNLSRS